MDVVFEAFAALVENGMDEEDQESLDYAAEILQAESEVYYARQSASKGQKGFAWGGSRNFQVQGQLSFEEKKARLQQVKNRTTCKRCGQYGHWQDDPICPKGSSRKGKGKKASSSSGMSSASTSGSKGKGGKPGKQEKPRNVYFTINEYESTGGANGNYGYMAVREGKEIPPPESLCHGVVLPAASSHEASTSVEVTPDELLDMMIVEADKREAKKRLKRREDEVSEDEVEEPTTEEIRFYLNTPARIAHLDRYLELADKSTPEYRDVYNERWTEFYPGHPMFVSDDRVNLRRWVMKAKLGLPVLPIEDQRPEEPSPVPHQFDISTPTSIAKPTTTAVATLAHSGHIAASTTTTTGPTCQHLRTTRQGSNAYVKMVKCRDCGAVLSHEKSEEKPQRMEHKDRGDCSHHEKDFRGTTATTWKWRCKDCGHQESGYKQLWTHLPGRVRPCQRLEPT